MCLWCRLALLAPIGALVVIADVVVFAEQCVVAEGGLGGDKAVEGIAGPGLFEGLGNDLCKRSLVYCEADAALELFDDFSARCGEAADLM